MRRRNDSFRLTDVMERSLRVLAGRLSTDARVWTGVHGRFGRRLAAEPVVRTETSSSIFASDLFSRRRPSHYGFYARSREQAASGEGRGCCRGATRGQQGQHPQLPGAAI